MDPITRAALPKPTLWRRFRWWLWRVQDRLGLAIHRRFRDYCERED